MPLYKIINPSDAYTFEALDKVIATYIVTLLGRGQYGAKSEDGEWTSPFFAFGPSDCVDKWFKDHGTTMDELLEKRRKEICDSMASVVIGGFSQRQLYSDAIEAIDDDAKRETFKEQWRDKNRSSMNDIGAMAKKYAQRLAEDPK